LFQGSAKNIKSN